MRAKRSLRFAERAARSEAAEKYQLASKLFTSERQGDVIGGNDLLIASTALSHGTTLVTHNVREFQRVPGLTLEDWTEMALDQTQKPCR